MRFTFFISKKNHWLSFWTILYSRFGPLRFLKNHFRSRSPVTFIAPNFSFRSPPEVGRFSRQFRRIHRFIGSSFDSEFRGGGGEVKEGWRLRLFSGFLDAFQKVVAETEVSLSF